MLELYQKVLTYHLETNEGGEISSLRPKTLKVSDEQRYLRPLSVKGMVGSFKYKILKHPGLMDSFNESAKDELPLPSNFSGQFNLEYSIELSSPYSCMNREIGLYPIAYSTNQKAALTGVNVNSLGRSGSIYLYLLCNLDGEWSVVGDSMVQQWCS